MASSHQTQNPPLQHTPTAEELLEEAEEAAGPGAQLTVVDAKTLKRLVSTLERKYQANVEQRIKYAHDPKKFLESEIELDEAIRGVGAVVTSPELYPDLVTLGVVPTFIALLHHENGDIAAAGIELLAELTDADAVEASEDAARDLVDALLEAGLLEGLVQRLQGLDESVAEEASGVYNALSLLENTVELRSETAAVAAASHPALLAWMLRRIRPKAEIDSNKQYTAEVLAVLLQAGGEESRRNFVEKNNGVELLLRAVAPYKSRNPESTEEEEFIENAYDVLCAVLMEPVAKRAFVDAAGGELMVLTLKGRTEARSGALKCLDFATTQYPPACDQVIDFGGLGTIFSVFMGKLKPAKKRGKRREEGVGGEEEERCVSIITNLLCDASGEERRGRVAAKFAENGYEKLDRWMEVFEAYQARVAAGERRIAEELEMGGEGRATMEDIEEELLLARLDAGLFVVQRGAVGVAELWGTGDVGMRKRLLTLLHQRGKTLSSLREVLVERRETLKKGEVEDEAGIKDIERMTALLRTLGYKDGEAAVNDKKRQQRDEEEDEEETTVSKKIKTNEEDS